MRQPSLVDNLDHIRPPEGSVGLHLENSSDQGSMLTAPPRILAKVLCPGTEAFTSNASGFLGEYRACTY